MSVVIAARGVTKVYRQGPAKADTSVEVHALRGVDLDVEQGEFTALVGPSGSGKSTLLNVVGTLDAPTAGVVDVAGKRVTGLSRKASALFRLEHIGFVFQAYNLLPVLTAYENAEYTLVLRGVSAAERRRVVTPLLERVGLADMMHRKPHELSGGQQQRVAVARALAARPALVLADEPTANLDSSTSTSLLDLMEELNRQDGTTFVFASHDATVVDRATRVVTLKDGLVHSDERR